MGVEFNATFGNKFGQGLHDGGTPKDKHKRNAAGFSFIDKDWERVHVICLGMTRIPDGTAATTASELRRVSLTRGWVLCSTRQFIQ